jgi:hypothetical protein
VHNHQHGANLAADEFPRDPSGLPEASAPAVLQLADGDTLDLRVAPSPSAWAMPPYGCWPTTAPSQVPR